MPHHPTRPWPIALLAVVACAACLPSPEGGGVPITTFLDESEGPCGADDGGETFGVSLTWQRWTYDSGPFASSETVAGDGVLVEARVGDAVCSSDRFYDQRQAYVFGPPEASPWLVMEADGALSPIRIVDGDGAVWAIEHDAESWSAPVPRTALVTASIMRSALLIQGELSALLPERVELPPLEIVWAEGVTRDCPACIVDGRIEISDELHDDEELTFWAGVVERQVVRVVMHHLGLIEAPVSGQMGRPEPGAEAWGQGAATYLLTVITPWERAFAAPRGASTSVGRQDFYDLAQFRWLPSFNGDLATDPIEPPVIAARLWRLPDTLPAGLVLDVMLSQMATYPFDNGAPGIDLVDFADALACGLDDAQRDSIWRELGYPPTCRQP